MRTVARLPSTTPSHRLSEEEFKRYEGQWSLTRNKVGQKRESANSSRCDFRLSSCSLKQKPSPSWIRHEVVEPIPPQQYRRWRSPQFLVDWDTSESWWSSWEVKSFVCCSKFRLQLIAIYCNRRACKQIHFTRHFLSCTVRTLNDVLHHIWLKNVFVRITPYSWSSMSFVWVFVASYIQNKRLNENVVSTGKRCVRLGPDGGTPQISSDRITDPHFHPQGKRLRHL